MCNLLEERETIKEQLFVCCEWRQVFFFPTAADMCAAAAVSILCAHREHTHAAAPALPGCGHKGRSQH